MTIVVDLRNARDPIRMDQELVRIARFFGCPSTLDEARSKRMAIEGQVRTHCAFGRLDSMRTLESVNVALRLWATGKASPATCVAAGNARADRFAAELSPVPPQAA